MDKQRILTEIRRIALANGGMPPGVRRFRNETGIKEFDWRGKFWARWGDALQEAGLVPNRKQMAFEEVALLEHLICLIREIGKFPTNSELLMKHRADKSFPSARVFERRFGGKVQLVESVSKYCRNRESYDDVLAACTRIPTSNTAPTSIPRSEEIIGHVYLMKSGRFYKIGRSNVSGRREYELAIQMPERLSTVHVIRTDDPVGIEAYWHNRFETKRKNGEWFDLSSTDVTAFKRRKFM